MIQIKYKYKYKFYGNFLRVPFPLLHWFGVGNSSWPPWQGGLAPLAFKRQAFPWRDAGPRLLRRRSEGKGEAGNSGGKSRNFAEVKMMYETVHHHDDDDDDGGGGGGGHYQNHGLDFHYCIIMIITISMSWIIMASATVIDRYLNFEIPSTSDFFTRMWTGVLRCSCSCRCFRRCRGARGLQRDCGSRFWMEPGRCISSDGEQFVNVRTQWLIEICRVCIVILQYCIGFAWVYMVYKYTWYRYIDVTRRYPTYLNTVSTYSDASAPCQAWCLWRWPWKQRGNIWDQKHNCEMCRWCGPLWFPRQGLNGLNRCSGCMVCLCLVLARWDSSQKMSTNGVHELFFCNVSCHLHFCITFANCRVFAANCLQDGDSDAKQMTMRLAIIGGSFILGTKQMEMNSTRKCHKHILQFMGQTWIGQMLLEYSRCPDNCWDECDITVMSMSL